MKPERFMLVHDAAKLASAAGKARSGRRRGARAATPKRERAQPERVGLWDLGAWLAGLPNFATRCNAVQKTFEFYTVKATVPAGTIRRPEGMAAWFFDSTGKRLSAKDRRELEDNVIADEFFALASIVRKDLALDYIVGVTPSMVAGTDGDEVYWNHFSSGDRRTILASTFDLREFASETKRPFEVYLGTVVLAQVLAACNPRLDYHDDRGCLFDYNVSRVSLRATVAKLHIEESCLSMITPRYRPAAVALTELLRTWEKS